MYVGFWLADVIGRALMYAQGVNTASPISGVPIAIVLGLLLRNFTPLPALLNPGLKFCVTTVLRLGIVLVGIRLSAFDVLLLGAVGVPVVLAAVATGLIFVTWFNNRLGLPPRLGTLIAAGTSICGVTAIVSIAPAIEADEREVAYAIANVVAFGLAAMLTYPYLAHVFLGRSETVGLFLGTAVHDTSQVVGAALTYRQMYGDPLVLSVATVTKLTRNLFLAAVIPLLTWMHLRRSHRAAGTRPQAKWTAYVPGFVIGFVAMAVVRSIGDYGVRETGEAFGLIYAGDWGRITTELGDYWASRVLLGTAMAAVGLNTSFSVFSGVGGKPFVVGFAGALVVGAVGMLASLLLGQYVSL
jgi:uncharacterized integral membrane protein (TIGR00698 family)